MYFDPGLGRIAIQVWDVLRVRFGINRFRFERVLCVGFGMYFDMGLGCIL